MSVAKEYNHGVERAFGVGMFRAGHLVAALLLTVTACAVPAPPSPSTAPSTLPGNSPAATNSQGPSLSIPPTIAPTNAVAGFDTWLAGTDHQYDLAIDGIAVGWGPVFGMVHVDGSDSYQLLTADSAAIWVYERSSLGSRTSRSVGVAYRPQAADLLPVERFQDALAASSGWIDVGTKEDNGQTLHHLVAGTTSVSDNALTSGTSPSDVPLTAGDSKDGKVGAWVSPDGIPVAFDYRSSGLSLDFLVEREIQPIAADVEPLARHTSKTFGYSFMAAPSTTYKPTDSGEVWTLGSIAFLTYCKPRSAGDNLEGWATEGYQFYEKAIGPGGGTMYAAVAPQGVGLPGTIDVAMSTYKGTTANFEGKAVVSASFGTKSYWCDLQAIAPTEHADEAHALLDRLLVTLEVGN